ncbi:hypothetical protein FGO68_gene1671 [Halteria grandinella]|uniref:Uncharacterized protein n=1 Tax=Halteria grandinella TaxID=5974 RepID=A0A8J8NDM7_HALGN|nr:hypothetical protein FGO68_gene1671 [Halteria grandinella]
MNDSVTSRRSVRQQKSVFPHLLRMQPDFEHLLDVQGSFDGGTTGGEHDLDKTISKLLNPRDVQKKSALKKRAGGLGSKNMVAKSGPLDMYVLKSEDYTQYALRQGEITNAIKTPQEICESKTEGELSDAMPVRMTSQRKAPQIIIEEEDLSMDVSRFNNLDDLENNDSESVSNNSSIAAPSRHDSGPQMNFSQLESSYDTKDEYEDREAVVVASASRSAKRGKSHFSKKTSNLNRLFSEELGMKLYHQANNIFQQKLNPQERQGETTPLSIQTIVGASDLTVKVMPKIDRNQFQKDLKARNRRMSSINKSQIHMNRLRSLGQSDNNLLAMHASAMKSQTNDDNNEEVIVEDDSMTN